MKAQQIQDRRLEVAQTCNDNKKSKERRFIIVLNAMHEHKFTSVLQGSSQYKYNLITAHTTPQGFITCLSDHPTNLRYSNKNHPICHEHHMMF